MNRIVILAWCVGWVVPWARPLQAGALSCTDTPQGVLVSADFIEEGLYLNGSPNPLTRGREIQNSTVLLPRDEPITFRGRFYQYCYAAQNSSVRTPEARNHSRVIYLVSAAGSTQLSGIVYYIFTTEPGGPSGIVDTIEGNYIGRASAELPRALPLTARPDQIVFGDYLAVRAILGNSDIANLSLLIDERQSPPTEQVMTAFKPDRILHERPARYAIGLQGDC